MPSGLAPRNPGPMTHPSRQGLLNQLGSFGAQLRGSGSLYLTSATLHPHLSFVHPPHFFLRQDDKGTKESKTKSFFFFFLILSKLQNNKNNDLSSRSTSSKNLLIAQEQKRTNVSSAHTLIPQSGCTQTLPRSRAARELYFSANSDILIVNRREVS